MQMMTDLQKQINSVNPMLQQSFLVMNSVVSENTRKRKQDICDGLGSNFKPYSSLNSSYLTMKQ